MVDRQISVRLSVEGADRVRAVLAAAGEEAADAFRAFEQGSTRGAQSFERLQRSIDPAYRASVQFAQAQEGINRAVAAGLVGQDRANELLALAAQRYRGVADAAQQMGAASTRGFAEIARGQEAAAGGVRNLGVIFGQASFQVQDFVGQVGAGTSALVAFSQQAPQFLGALGAGGAIAGAAVAIGALALQLLGAGKATDTLTEALERADDFYDRAAKGAESYREGLEAEGRRVQELTAYYATLTRERAGYEQRELFRRRDELDTEANTLRDSIRPSLRATTRQAAFLERDLPFAISRANSQGQDTTALRAEFENAREAADLIRQFNQARGADETAASFLKLAEGLRQIAFRGGEFADVARDLVQGLDAQVASAEKLDARVRSNAAQQRALTAATAESGVALGEAAGQADGAGAAMGRLGAASQGALAALRGLGGIQLPGLDGLAADADRAAARLRAIQAGGTEGAERFDREEEVLKRVAAAREADIKSIIERQRVSREAATAIAGDVAREEARYAEAVRGAEAEAAANRALAEAREKEAAGRRRQTAAAREARAEARTIYEAGDGTVFPIDAVQPALDRARDAQQRAEADRQQRLQRAIEDEERRRAESFDRTVERYSADLARGTAEALLDGTRRSEPFFQRLTNVFRRGLTNAVAGGLDSAVFRPLVSAGFQAIGLGSGGGGGIGALFSAAGSALGLGNVGASIGGLFSGNAVPVSAGAPIASSTAELLAQVQAPPNYGAMGLGLFQQVGLNGIGSTLNSLGVSSGLFGNGISPLAQGPTLSGAPLGSLSQSGLLGSGTLTSTLGGAAAGFGIGVAGGNIVGGLRGSANAMQNSLIGSGIGLILGGPIGAAIGGTVSGFFGPTKKGMAARSGGDVFYGVNAAGQLVITNARGKRWDQAGAVAQVQGQLDQANAAAAQRGLTFDTGFGGAIGFGQASRNPGELSEADLVRSLRGGSGNVQTALSGLGARSAGLEEALSAVDWVTQVYEPLIQTTDAYNEQLRETRRQYDEVAGKARELGLAEEGIAAARDKALAQLEAERAATLRSADANLSARLAQTRGDARGAALITFDDRALAEQDSYRRTLETLGVATADVATRMGRLGEVLAAERAALLDAPRQQAAGSAAGVVRGLAGFAEGLLVGETSPLSPEERYALARSRFEELSGRATGGDLAAAGGLQASAQALLAISRDINGSGLGFRQDTLRVIETLDRFADVSGDLLTAAAQEQITEKQTDVLQRELVRLQALVESLLRQQQLAALVPLRAA